MLVRAPSRRSRRPPSRGDPRRSARHRQRGARHTPIPAGVPGPSPASCRPPPSTLAGAGSLLGGEIRRRRLLRRGPARTGARGVTLTRCFPCSSTRRCSPGPTSRRSCAAAASAATACRRQDPGGRARRQARVFVPGSVRLLAAVHGVAPSLLDCTGAASVSRAEGATQCGDQRPRRRVQRRAATRLRRAGADGHQPVVVRNVTDRDAIEVGTSIVCARARSRSGYTPGEAARRVAPVDAGR